MQELAELLSSSNTQQNHNNPVT